MLLLTPRTVPAWHEGDGYAEVGDGTGTDPLSDLEYPPEPERDDAADKKKQYTKVGGLFAEGNSRRGLRVLLRLPLLPITTDLFDGLKRLLGLEPRVRPVREAAPQAEDAGGEAEGQGGDEDDGGEQAAHVAGGHPGGEPTTRAMVAGTRSETPSPRPPP